VAEKVAEKMAEKVAESHAPENPNGVQPSADAVWTRGNTEDDGGW
jgi:hypothetical protein